LSLEAVVVVEVHQIILAVVEEVLVDFVLL
jgi:hypothetical protein